MDTHAIANDTQPFFDQAIGIWLSGGWAMIPIAAVAMIIFAVGTNVYLTLRGKGYRSVAERTWRRWIDHPGERIGPIGRLLDFVTTGTTLKETATFFEELRGTEVAPIARDLRLMKICVSAAPLLGLLGTVTGMLDTFGALSSGSGGEKTMELVAGGISEALYTTETGLVIGLLGLFFQHQLARGHERYQAFLAHLETVCTQSLYRKLRRERAATTLSEEQEKARAALADTRRRPQLVGSS